MVEEGTPPDIIVDFTHQLPFLLENEVIEHDMFDMATMHGVDVDQFEQAFIDQLRIQQKGILYALPLVRSVHALRYYPEVIVELGLEMPYDQMTWEEYISWLSPLLEQDEYLVHVSGLEARLLIAQQLFSMVDHERSDVLTNQMVWKNVISIYENLWPGRPLTAGFRANNDHLSIFRLFAENNELVTEANAWDFISWPTFAEHPGISPDYVSDIIAPSAYTNHVEEAMQVIGVLVSEEFQTELSRIGLGSPLASPAVHEQFGAGTTEYQGKNVQAFFQHKPVANSLFSEQELQASQIIYPYLVSIYEGMDAERQLDLLLEELERMPFGNGE